MKRLKLMFLRFAGRMSKLVKAVFAFPCIHGQTAAARNKAWITTLRAMYHRISMCMDYFDFADYKRYDNIVHKNCSGI